MSDSAEVEQGEQNAAAAGQAAATEAIRRRSRAYRDGRLVAQDFPLEMISEWSAKDCAIWFDLPDPTPEELETLREELGLHSLAIEDATHLVQRPKLDRYEGHLVLSAYQVRPVNGAELDSAMVLGFITPKALVTVHKAGAINLDALTKHWDDLSELSKFGVPFLVYGLIDNTVDGYFDALQTLDDTIEELSDAIFDTAAGRESATALRRTFELRRGILTARHVITPMREVVNALMRLTAIDPELMPYYQDLYDHVLRAADWTDNLRDLLGTVRETQLTIQGNRMNLIMKKVTSWAAIIAVPTAVTGFYGQNVPYPGFSTSDGFWTSTALILALSALLYWSFKRRDWL